MIYLGLEKGVGVECRMILCVPVAGVLLVIYPGLGTGAADGRVDRTGVVEWWEEQWGQFGQCSAQCAVTSAGLISHGAISTIPPTGPRLRSIRCPRPARGWEHWQQSH